MLLLRAATIRRSDDATGRASMKRPARHRKEINVSQSGNSIPASQVKHNRPPEDPVGIGGPVAVSPIYEAQVKTLRRCGMAVSLGKDVVILRPYGGTGTLRADAGVIEEVYVATQEHGTDTRNKTNSHYCTCRTGSPSPPCIHREALDFIGGVPVFYEWLRNSLRNPILLRCAVCTTLLDGNRDWEITSGFCPACLQREPEDKEGK